MKAARTYGRKEAVPFSLCAVLLWSLIVPSASAQERVAGTVHNLSASGPGPFRAAEEQQVCIFCHTPHNASGARPLWNRQLSVAGYRIYQSSTLNARPGQPTGASKLCLSCHDGTIAVGSVLSRVDRIRMVGGDFMPAGLTNLGTDLSDDHPISFDYTSGLAAADRQLVNPLSLRPEVKLDTNGQLQCTACHDPHHNPYGDFLVVRAEYGELCTACHAMEGWRSSSHALANTGVGNVGNADWPFSTVAENACRSCHRPHSAGGRQRLLILENEEDNCLRCHDGVAARRNILAELDKSTAHDPRRYLGAHDPREALSGNTPHVECADCHNPHATEDVGVSTSYVPIGPTLGHVRGVTITGAGIEEAQYEYEVCFRCHGDSAVEVHGSIGRQAQTPNLRLKFSPGNPSYHPVVMSSASRDTLSLAPGIAPGSMIRCTDCHNNDAGPRAGGGGPDGPHGSSYGFLLERNYTIDDDTPESESAYALCYKCHQRTSILSDNTFSEHRKHIVEERTPCVVCHDPHGIATAYAAGSDHTHLINFNLSVVRPDRRTQRIVYRDLGTFAGSCTLLCHGEDHRDEQYGQHLR